MPFFIRMPTLSPTMEEGLVSSWKVEEGDAVRAGDVVGEIETDKAVMELEAEEDGRMGKILRAAGGEMVPVNSVIAIVLREGEGEGEIQAALQTIESEEKGSAAAPLEEAPPEENAEKSAEESAAKSAAVSLKAPQTEIPEEAAYEGETAEQTVREALCQAMAEEMRRDESVFVMGEEVASYEGAYKVTRGLLKEFGERRVIDTPVTEHGFAGLGVGAAFGGLRPVIEFMTFNFAMQAIDQIVNSAAKTLYMSGGQMGCPIVFRGPNGPAPRVGAQHSQDYSSWYAHIPGLKVVAPYDARDAKGLLKSAIRDANPVIFLENELLYGLKAQVPQSEDFTIPLGQSLYRRRGSDVTLVSYSHALLIVHEAAERLAADGIECEIVDLRSLRPLDLSLVLQSVEKTHRVVTVENGWPVCSIGAEVCARVTAERFDFLDAPPQRVSGRDVPMPYAANLEKAALPSVEDVVKAARDVC